MAKVVTAALLISCATFSATEGQEWRTDSLFVLAGPGGPQTHWGSISGVTASRGKIFVFDRLERTLYGLADDGSLLWRVGHSGSGPGDFSSLALTVIRTNQDQLVVPDLGNQRLSIFYTDGRFQRSYPFVSRGGSALEWFALRDRIVYGVHPFGTAAVANPLEQQVREATYIMRTFAGTEDTLLKLPRPAPFTITPDGRMVVRMGRPSVTVASDGEQIYAVSSEKYEIMILKPPNGPSRTSRRSVRQVDVPDTQRRAMERDANELAARLKAQLPQASNYRLSFEYPSHLPAVREMIAGDDLLIVKRGDVGTPDGQWIYDIFYEHEYAGYLTLPPQYRPKAISNSRIVGVVFGDFDVPSLFAFALRRPER